MLPRSVAGFFALRDAAGGGVALCLAVRVTAASIAKDS